MTKEAHGQLQTAAGLDEQKLIPRFENVEQKIRTIPAGPPVDAPDPRIELEQGEH